MENNNEKRLRILKISRKSRINKSRKFNVGARRLIAGTLLSQTPTYNAQTRPKRLTRQQRIQDIRRRLNFLEILKQRRRQLLQQQAVEDAKHYAQNFPMRQGNYALKENERSRALLDRYRRDQKHHDLMQAHRDSMVKVPMNFLDTQNNILDTSNNNIMLKRPDSIDLTARRPYNILTPTQFTRLGFFKHQGQYETEETDD